MKKLDLNQTLAALANLGVILGIVFLSLQLSQSNKLLRSQAGYNMLQNRVSYREEIFRNPEVADLMVRVAAAQSLDELSAADLRRFQAERERQWLSMQWEYTQYLDGNLSEDELIAAAPENPNLRQLWDRFKSDLRPDFVKFMEDRRAQRE